MPAEALAPAAETGAAEFDGEAGGSRRGSDNRVGDFVYRRARAV